MPSSSAPSASQYTVLRIKRKATEAAPASLGTRSLTCRRKLTSSDWRRRRRARLPRPDETQAPRYRRRALARRLPPRGHGAADVAGPRGRGRGVEGGSTGRLAAVMEPDDTSRASRASWPARRDLRRSPRPLHRGALPRRRRCRSPRRHQRQRSRSPHRQQQQRRNTASSRAPRRHSRRTQGCRHA